MTKERMQELCDIRWVGSDELQEMLEYMNENEGNKQKFIKAYGKEDRDLKAILSIEWYEDFTRYDSDVAERFVYAWRNMAKKELG